MNWFVTQYITYFEYMGSTFKDLVFIVNPVIESCVIVRFLLLCALMVSIISTCDVEADKNRNGHYYYISVIHLYCETIKLCIQVLYLYAIHTEAAI